MVMSVGGAAVGAQPPATGGARGGPGRRNRRDLLLGLLGPAAVAVALAPLVGVERVRRAAEPPADLVFDETYRGRRIRGVRTSVSAAGGALGGAAWHVTVDGRQLHLMRRADGTWLSMVDHYRSYATPLDAARAAVDELGPGQLRETGPAGQGHMGGQGYPGGQGGVHA